MILDGNLPEGIVASDFDYESGQTTWEYLAPDGTLQKMRPPLLGGTGVAYKHFFASPPTHHLGKELEDPFVETMAKLYLDYLSDVVERAEEEFMPT